ncbi:hypothetical protein V7183_17945, partial [Bacillus sp. JJ1127]|uniref:hypothetical protein n=1 Tax=Bacillus sp. JJ1127 TaxID=3122952 RepID=UPI002FFE9A63
GFILFKEEKKIAATKNITELIKKLVAQENLTRNNLEIPVPTIDTASFNEDAFDMTNGIS